MLAENAESARLDDSSRKRGTRKYEVICLTTLDVIFHRLSFCNVSSFSGRSNIFILTFSLTPPQPAISRAFHEPGETNADKNERDQKWKGQKKNLFIKGLKNIRTDKRLIIYLMARWASAQIQEHKNEPHIFPALRQTHKKN